MSESTQPPRRETLRELLYLFTYLRPHRGRFFTAFAASLLSMSLGVMFPWLLGHLVDAAIPSANVAEKVIWNPGVNTIALLLLGTLVGQSILTFFSSTGFNVVGETAVVDIRRRLYATLVSLPMRFFGERRVGELTSRLSSDLTQLQDMFTFVVPQIIRQAMLCSCGLIAITVTSWRLSLIMVLSLPPVVLTAVWFGRKVRSRSRDAQDRLAGAATILEETLQNIASVKAFANEGYEVRRYGSSILDYLGVVLPMARMRAGLIAFIILGVFGSITLVMWSGARLMQAGIMSHGELTRFTLYTILIGGSVASTADIFSSLNKTLGASQRVRELFRETPELPHSADLHEEAASRPHRTSLAGDVRFDSIEFRYPSRADVQVLRGLTLSAAPGEKVALVGPSGAGKSTIVSLLLRFYEPDAGTILLDGKPASSYDLASVRGAMAIVPQEVMLFGGSIRENIAYGRPGATEEEIRTAARRANCHEFIERFPEGYDTVVGDRGVKLSGGQRQRIAIARALLKDPAILILDEATSSLDSESELLIQQALDTLMEGRTSFIIAHRLATVRQVDRIYVIEEGCATESGTHEELMERPGGTYRRLSELQFSV